MLGIQESYSRKAIKMSGMLDKAGFPSFKEFVDNYVPKSLLEYMWEQGGGKQSAEATATLELMYSVLIVMKAGDAVFEISQDLVVALRDTDVMDTRVSELKLPFEGISIDIPKGTFAPPGEFVSRIHVSRLDHDGRFRLAFTTSPEHASYASMLVDDDTLAIKDAVSKTESINLDIPEETLLELQKDAAYKNFYRADVFRFAVNTVLYVTSDQADVVQDKSEENKIHERLHGEKKKSKRLALEKELAYIKSSKLFIVGAKFRLGKEYKADLTESGRVWVLKHRCRVMGYWRSQPYGPKQSLRKRIWIAPYFKGPDMAEMINKGYVVT